MLKENRIFISVFIVIIVIGCNSCRSILSGREIDEGTIVYEITYLDDEKDNPLIALLPKKMITKFKNNNTVSYIEGFFGTFKLTYLTDIERGKNYSILRILDKKYIYEFSNDQEPAGYGSMTDMEIQKLDSVTEIAGYECQKATVICKKISDKPLELYYTYGIAIKNPNTNNPFREIDGVLLGFQVKLTAINMKFVAQEVIEEDVDDSEFKVPDGYLSVSKTELEEILESFQNTSE